MNKKNDFDMKLGFFIIGIVISLAVSSFFYTPYDPYTMDISHRFNGVSIKHLLGTDNFGRDIFSRVITGARFTLFVAICTVSSGTLFGIILGLTAGYLGGVADEIIMRIIDAINSFPAILLALVMVTVLNQGKYTIIVALCILFVPSFTRIVRSGTLQYKNNEFVKLAQVIGASPLRIMFVHILPNLYPTLLSAIVVGLSNAILAESGMSYLGLGIQPPIPSWGRMLYEAQTHLFHSPLSAFVPGMFIIITVLGFNFLGEGIRKRLN
ncbi:ABC transporter permease [Ruminiclostridium papyrosolvens]|uniref:ABC transporter permease n=1 Tax=Ruminiclostridium papyrosolvens C7 TaxID=1330534 RepID=U4R571_9FIRM|nr:ABC transporter permease [Ruminiclostridium papyrosolvens]EPR13559.1 ABC transporter permease [Ruminiclostridium papyrosolvens C7]